MFSCGVKPHLASCVSVYPGLGVGPPSLLLQRLPALPLAYHHHRALDDYCQAQSLFLIVQAK